MEKQEQPNVTRGRPRKYQNEEEILNLNHYTNLQPLCSKINRDIKKDNLNYISIYYLW